MLSGVLSLLTLQADTVTCIEMSFQDSGVVGWLVIRRTVSWEKFNISSAAFLGGRVAGLFADVHNCGDNRDSQKVVPYFMNISHGWNF